MTREIGVVSSHLHVCVSTGVSDLSPANIPQSRSGDSGNELLVDGTRRSETSVHIHDVAKEVENYHEHCQDGVYCQVASMTT